jgi:3-oxoacyl-[acyl-carrier-protein] synthase-3
VYETLAAREQYLQMNGNEVFKFAVRAIPLVTRQALKESHLTVGDVTWLVPHQANQRILDTIADRLGIPHDHVVSTIETTGNTSSASIPLAMDALYTAGNLQPGDVCALVGFGAGLTWGAAIIRWTKPNKESR